MVYGRLTIILPTSSLLAVSMLTPARDWVPMPSFRKTVAPLLMDSELAAGNGRAATALRLTVPPPLAEMGPLPAIPPLRVRVELVGRMKLTPLVRTRGELMIACPPPGGMMIWGSAELMSPVSLRSMAAPERV